MYHVRRLTIAGIVLSLFVFLTWLLPRLLNPTPPTPEARLRDQHWIDSSPFWVDRQLCRWVSLCGVEHIRWDPPDGAANGTKRGHDRDDLRRLELRSTPAWKQERSGHNTFDGLETEGRSWEVVERASRRARSPVERAAQAGGENGGKTLREIPDYVLRHAPLVHLSSDEHFWPADMAEHVRRTTPYVNGSALDRPDRPPYTLSNLRELDGEPMVAYLTSDDDVEARPEWLLSTVGIPSPFDDDGEDEGPGSGSDETKDAGGTGGGPPPAEDSTWYDVDLKHPLHRISDPRNVPSPHDDGSRVTKRPRGAPGDLHRRRWLAQHPIVSSALTAAAAKQGHEPDAAGYSEAPAVLIMVDKGSGILDAFWFFFYSFNLGQTVLDIRFGNHVGDWEHCMVRFENGVPRALALSQHAGGQAYAWSAMEKWHPHMRGDGSERGAGRPVIYSAVGSHAMYATPGLHPYVLPFKMLRDITDKGPLWDPAQNQYAYFYDYEAEKSALAADGSDGGDEPIYDETAGNNLEPIRRRYASDEKPESLTPAASNPDAPTSWFHFEGAWGDETYGLGDARQWRLFGQYHYLTGPQGPKFKNLGRRKVCQNDSCRILYDLEAGKKARWYN